MCPFSTWVIILEYILHQNQGTRKKCDLHYLYVCPRENFLVFAVNNKFSSNVTQIEQEAGLIILTVDIKIFATDYFDGSQTVTCGLWTMVLKILT